MANAIKYWREKRNITQQKLADEVKIDRPTLSKIENPKIPIDPDHDIALKISLFLGVIITDIMSTATED